MKRTLRLASVAAALAAATALAVAGSKSITLPPDGAEPVLARSVDFAANPPGQKTFLVLRFGHTGEIFGPAGQAVALLASAAAAVMVWTGLALAWRRLVQPALRRRRAAAGQ